MKVQKRVAGSDPGYPSRRQFSQYGRLLAGVATIGLGAAVGRSGEDVRVGGDIAVEPRPPVRPARTAGLPRCEAGPAGVSTNLPVATTNLPAATGASTNKPLAELRIRGKMPAEPR
jgi:hypothetical protein